MQEQLRHEEITHKIIGCAMQVHTIMGNGFQEVIYQRALEIEMSLRKLSFEREKDMDVYYKEILIDTRRVDFFVEDNIMVELKSVITPEDVHLAQAINYLEAYNMEVGLLLNFGSKSLTYKRLLNREFRQK
ncbi:MAG: GxxExxY protein [Mucilaginibacter sp.]|nr:GxxExxY protein [Mucilaginibacter sp.]